MQYVIPAALAFLVGVTLWAIKRERLSLSYDIVESEIFPRQNTSGKYFACTLRNSGNRPIQDIAYAFRVNGGKIDSVEFSDSKLFQLSCQDDNVLEGTISLLNPKEELGAVVTITEANKLSVASLEARAVGATARLRSQDALPDYMTTLMAGITAGVAVSVVLSMWTFHSQYREGLSTKGISERMGSLVGINQKLQAGEKTSEELLKTIRGLEESAKLWRSEKDRAKPGRELKVFAILNKAGVGFILPKLLASGDELPYWKTGLCIMHSYLTDKKNARKYLIGLDQLSSEEAIAPESKGFLLYLAGKIEQDQGNGPKATEYMEKCKAAAPLTYDLLMAQDPAYDLRAVERIVSDATSSTAIKRPR